MSADYELERVILGGSVQGDHVWLICVDCDEMSKILNGQPVWKYTEWADNHVCPAGKSPREISAGHLIDTASGGRTSRLGSLSIEDALAFPLHREKGSPRPRTHHVRYEVSLFPFDAEEHLKFRIEVQHLRDGLWTASRDEHFFLEEDGTWTGMTNEIDTAHLERAFLRAHAYPREVALRLAWAAAPNVYSSDRMFAGTPFSRHRDPGPTALEVYREMEKEMSDNAGDTPPTKNHGPNCDCPACRAAD